MELFFHRFGQGKPLIILHGLLGSADNWLTVSKPLAEKYEVFLLDQRNHGRSFQSDDFSIPLLVQDLHQFMQEQKIEKPLLLGHSMGGKTVMNFAVAHPNAVSRLMVADIVPKRMPPHHEHIFQGLMTMDIASIKTRQEANEYLAKYVATEGERQFLLKNLARSEDGKFFWRANLASLHNHQKELNEGLVFSGKFLGKTLFIFGTKSTYYQQGDKEQWILPVFPQAELQFIEAGHWVQADNPKDFLQTVHNFLADD